MTRDLKPVGFNRFPRAITRDTVAGCLRCVLREHNSEPRPISERLRGRDDEAAGETAEGDVTFPGHDMRGWQSRTGAPAPASPTRQERDSSAPVERPEEKRPRETSLKCPYTRCLSIGK